MAFSTGSSKSAYDGNDGKNGVYTHFLLNHIKEKITVETMLKLVSTEVQTKTNSAQKPWVESSYTGVFSLVSE